MEKKIKRKLRKNAVAQRVKAIIEGYGGSFLRINWKKGTVHFLTPTNNKKTDSLGIKFGIYG